MNNNENKKTQVLILGTLHGYHKKNPNYTYEHIFQIISEFNPDIIGVEIRPEDMDQPREYLEKYYPYEMIEPIFRYKDEKEVKGFDWYTKDVEGVKFTIDTAKEYFEKLPSKVLFSEFQKDKSYELVRDMLDVCNNRRMEVITANPTPAEMNDSRYDIACAIYYNQLEIAVKNTKYEVISTNFQDRDKHIDENICNIVENNNGKKLIFLLGADHRVFAIKALKERFNDKINLIQL